MATKVEVEEFINKAIIPKPQQLVLLTRLDGVSQKNEEVLTDKQIQEIFEGRPDLLEKFLTLSTGSIK